MRPQPCPSCGAGVERGTPRCPSCGTDLDLRVEPLSGDQGDGRDVALGRDRSRWWTAAVVVGAVVLLGAGAVLAGGRAPRAADTTTTTTTSATTPTTVAPTTSAPAGPTTSTTTTTTVPARLALPGAPLLGIPTGGAVLHAVDRRLATLWRVDLDTGDATTRPTGRPPTPGEDPFPGAPVALVPRRGGVVFAVSGGQVVFLPDEPERPPVALAEGAVWPLAHADPGLVWIVTEDALRPQARVVDLAGTVVAGPVALPFARVLGDDGTGRLLLPAGGGTYALGVDGSATRVTEQPLVAWGGDRLVTVECAATVVQCELAARSRDGEERGRTAAPDLLTGDTLTARLSPGGGAVVALGFGPSGVRLELHHFDGRPERSYAYLPPVFGGPVGAPEPPLWWVDEEGVCGVEDPGTLRCWSDGATQSTFLVDPPGLPALAVAVITPAERTP